MQLGELLAALDATHHHGRIQIMLAAGRDPERAELCRRLRAKGAYLRQLAFYAAVAGGDAEYLVEMALDDPSRRLRQLALRQCARLASPEQLQHLLDRLAPAPRRRLLVRLLQARRGAIGQAWLASQESPPLELLAYAAPEQLDRQANRLTERAGYQDWVRLTRNQPGWTAAHILDAPRALGRSYLVSGVLAELARLRSPLALELWRRATAAGYPARELGPGRVVHCDPAGWTRWALQHEQAPPWDFAPLAARLPLELCRQLLQRGWLRLDLRWWLRRSPVDRGALWSDFHEAVRNPDGYLEPRWLRALPTAQRVLEARRQSQLATAQLRPTVQVEFLSMLGYASGLEELRPFFQAPDVETRASALGALTQLGRYQPEHRAEILEILTARANEADPARSAFVHGLAELPPAAWRPEHFKALGEVLKALLGAADASPYSFTEAQRLVLRLLPHQPAWSAAWLGKLLRQYGSLALGGWRNYLTGAHTFPDLEEELGSVLQDWERRESWWSVFTLYQALGPDLERFPRLLQRLAALCSHPQADPSRQALQLLETFAPRQAGALIPDLLARDPSWISQSAVQTYLDRRRQDLLTPFLTRSTPMTGKFASGLSDWIIVFRNRFWRWTPEQQHAYALRLKALLDNPQRELSSSHRCLDSLSRLPATPPGLLESYAGLSETRTAVRDTALRALGRMDAGQGVAALLEALGDERARIAIYALRRALLEMPPELALERLRSISSPKLTVQKEVARLLGELPEGLGLSTLLERLSGDLRRDLRLAHLRALWDYLDHTEVWPHLQQAAHSPDPAYGLALCAIPVGRSGAQARALLADLTLTLLAHPVARVRLAAARRLAVQRLPEAGERLAPALVALLEKDGEAATAAHTLMLYYEERPEDWSALLQAQLSRPKALHSLLEAMQQRGAVLQQRFRPLMKAALKTLEAAPITLPYRLRLGAANLELADLLETIEGLELWEAFEAARLWPELLRLQAHRLDAERWQQIQRRWADHDQAPLRRLALEALQIHIESFGWTEAGREALALFQKDTHGLVGARAQFLFPPPVEA